MQESVTEPPSIAVIEAVADRDSVDETALETPLFDVIDPCALDALFHPKPDGTARGGGTVTFSYEGYAVTVQSDGTVTLQN